MTNAVYQATVEALEALMSPRIVSRSLQEGLKQVGKSPVEVSYSDVEKILKSQVYRQLQVTMPVTEAKGKIVDILQQIKNVDAKPDPALNRTLEQQAQTLEMLQENLRPFNMYFEWPEVQKLRAQLQLIEAEQAAGRESSRLLQEARAQFGTVQQKLEDQLVQQARALAELEEGFESVKALGGPRVRRLESLVGHLGEAQQARQLAPAEVERARKLVTELHKLMEASLEGDELADAPALELTPVPRDDELLEREVADPERQARFHQLELESEQRQLTHLQSRYELLLAYQPAWQERLQALAAQLEQGRSVAAELAALPAQLEQGEQDEQQRLTEELRALLEELNDFPETVDLDELSYQVQVTLSVLEATLPPQRDLQHLRSLAQLAREQARDLAQQQEVEREAQAQKLVQQQAALERLEASLQRYQHQHSLSEELGRLAQCLSALREAQDQSRLEPELQSEARQAEIRLEAAAATYAEAQSERQQVALHGMLSELRSLPLEPQARLGLEQRLEAALADLERGPLAGDGLDDLRRDLDAVEAELRARYLRALAAFRERAAALEAKPLLSRLASDEQGLEQDLYPDLREIERALAGATEARRAEQLHDLHRLENELSSYHGKGLSEAAHLQRAIDEARQTLERGEALPALEPLWDQLEALQSSLVRRSAGFVPRLDAALALQSKVARLNSDEVAAVGRILRHLDSQRDAFHRVSAGMQSELEALLQEAEMLLVELEAQDEATQVVAGQLAGGSLLDDLFGDGDAAPEADEEKLSQALLLEATPPAERLSGHDPEVDAWLDGMLREAGVTQAMLFAEGGRPLSGYLSGNLAERGAALHSFLRHITSTGQALELGAARLSLLESARRAILVSEPAPGYQLLLSLENLERQTEVLHRLQTQLPQLRDLLAPSVTEPR